jgi:hypothetical protein
MYACCSCIRIFYPKEENCQAFFCKTGAFFGRSYDGGAEDPRKRGWRQGVRNRKAVDTRLSFGNSAPSFFQTAPVAKLAHELRPLDKKPLFA